jgi:hypothetical protein
MGFTSIRQMRRSLGILRQYPKFVFHEEASYNFLSLETPANENEKKTVRQLVAQGYYSSIANCRTKTTIIFRGLFATIKVNQHF